MIKNVILALVLLAGGVALAASFTVQGSWLMDTQGNVDTQPFVASAELEIPATQAFSVVIGGVAGTESFGLSLGNRLNLTEDSFITLRAAADWPWDTSTWEPTGYSGNLALGWVTPEGFVIELGALVRTTDFSGFSVAPQIGLGYRF